MFKSVIDGVCYVWSADQASALLDYLSGAGISGNGSLRCRAATAEQAR